MQRIALLGSTGSIGRQTLEVVAAHPERMRVVALAAGGQVDLLNQQIDRFHPDLVSVADPGHRHEVRHPRVKAGEAGLVAAATHPEVDVVLVATVGHTGFVPTLAAIRAGKTIALANKEVLVMAGELVTAEARRHQVRIRPVDSEHSAIWQCLQGEPDADTAPARVVRRLVLTASGGPFRCLPWSEMSAVTPERAMHHPTWNMGSKITIDSATLMNKGLEVIEAHWLFNLPYEAIDVIVHPESIVHSLVEFIDGSVKAQLGVPDMRLPIQYALGYPDRLPGDYDRLDLVARGSLTFSAPDLERFPCLRLAFEAGRRHGTYPAVLAGADEEAVALFLAGAIGFTDIPRLIEEVLARHSSAADLTLEAITEADAWARREVRRLARAPRPITTC